MQGKPFGVMILTGLSALLAAGQTQSSPLQLHIQDETRVNCLHLDSNGWRDYPGGEEFYVEEAFDRYAAVSLKGECRSALNTALIPSTPSVRSSDVHIIDVANRDRGGVIAAAVWSVDEHTHKPAIVLFDGDGEFSRIVFLEPDFFPTHAAEFSSGRGFVVTGYDRDKRVYAALVTSEGKVLNPDVLKGPDDPVTAAEPGAASQQPSMDASLMQLVSGDDDAVYLYSARHGRKVFRIRPDGTFTAINLGTSAAPKGERTLPLGMFISHSSLYLHEALLDASKSDQQAMALNRFLLSVYDRYTGKLDHAYINDASFGGNPVAMAPHEFYFLKATTLPNGTLSFSLIRATE